MREEAREHQYHQLLDAFNFMLADAGTSILQLLLQCSNLIIGLFHVPFCFHFATS